MENVVAAINMTHPMLTEAPDVDSVSKFNGLRENGRHLISSVITSKGGRVIGDYEGSVLVELPVEQSAVLKELKKRLHEESGLKYTSIGLGESVEDAMVAVKEAAKDYSIKVFRPEMAEEESPVESPSVAVGAEDEPVRKAEVSEDAQKTIATLVDKISQNKDYVESMKQSNPQAYESLVDVMQALAAMVSHVKDTQARKTHEDERARLEKVVNSVHDGKFDEDERAILHEILASMQPKSYIKKAEDYIHPKIAKAESSFVKGTNCSNCKFLDKKTLRKADPERLNSDGGIDPRTEEETARSKSVDLITLPGEPQSEVSMAFCKHKEVLMDVTDRMCCARWNNVGVDRPWLSKAEGDTNDVIGQAVVKLHSAIPHFERIRNENPEVFGSFVKMVRLLQAMYEDHTAMTKPAPQEQLHVRPPAKEEPLRHPKPTYMPGSIRNYSPQSARQKTTGGEWVSVAGGTKRSE